MKTGTVLLALALTTFLPALAQEDGRGTARRFCSLSGPEKCWVLRHPFIAKKCWKLSREARMAADRLKAAGALDGDDNGGQIDAFRHAYWMALLARQVAWRKARRLGRAHEKGNYRTYRKGGTEDGELPDKASSDMDLWNNDQGIAIGRNHKDVPGDSLITPVIAAIKEGRMKVIRKDAQGRCLDASGRPIPAERLKDTWINDKCLVPSAYERPE